MLQFNKDDLITFAGKGSRAVIGTASLLLADKDPNFVLMYADIGCRVSAEMVYAKYPEKCIQCGIAEQNMVGVASALANEGFNVTAVTYAPFISGRVLDQIRVNMSIMESPVVLIGLSAGFFMSDLGPSLTALEDIAHLRSLPNITVISPADCTEIVKAMIALSNYKKPAYLRITCGFENQYIYQDDYDFEIGKAIMLRKGTDTAIIATGTIVFQCLEAAKILEEKGISCAVINMHTIKPLDSNIIDSLDYKMLFTVEEHSIIGGLGGAVAEHYADKKNTPQLIRIGTSDKFFNADSFSVSLENAGLSSSGIANQIMKHYYE